MFLESLRTLIARFKNALKFYRRLMSHPRCPRISRICLGAAIAYVLSPIDIIPDIIPILGYLDEIIILSVLIYLAMRFIPKDLAKEIRMEMKNESE